MSSAQLLENVLRERGPKFGGREVFAAQFQFGAPIRVGLLCDGVIKNLAGFIAGHRDVSCGF
jgi:hypothetical protein